MSNYPDWVIKHKKKGTYINFANGKYYLYAAHSERVPGTKKVRRVSDGYLGRITEKDGLIPHKDKVKGEILVYEYGTSALLVQIGRKIHAGLRRSFRLYADFIFVAAILCFLYARYDKETFRQSSLSLAFPDVAIDKTPTKKQQATIERTQVMLKTTLDTTFGEDTMRILELCSFWYRIQVNQTFYRSKQIQELHTLLQQHGILWEGYNGKDW